jgi:hypothetical protein
MQDNSWHSIGAEAAVYIGQIPFGTVQAAAVNRRTYTSRNSTDCCRKGRFLGRTGCYRIGTSRGSKGCFKQDTSRIRTVCCRRETSDKAKCALGQTGTVAAPFAVEQILPEASQSDAEEKRPDTAKCALGQTCIVAAQSAVEQIRPEAAQVDVEQTGCYRTDGSRVNLCSSYFGLLL